MSDDFDDDFLPRPGPGSILPPWLILAALFVIAAIAWRLK